MLRNGMARKPAYAEEAKQLEEQRLSYSSPLQEMLKLHLEQHDL